MSRPQKLKGRQHTVRLALLSDPVSSQSVPCPLVSEAVFRGRSVTVAEPLLPVDLVFSGCHPDTPAREFNSEILTISAWNALLF